MGLFSPQGVDFRWSYTNASLGISTMGTSIVPATGDNTFGSWAQVASAASISTDVYGIYIHFNAGNTSAVDRRILVDLGVDPAGGTNYTTVIPYLVASKAPSPGTMSGGIYYYFPLFIKAGSSVACRASSSTTTNVYAAVTFYGLPTRPEAVRVGSYVTAFGVITSSYSGASMTSGTSSYGAWRDLAPTDKDYWWWQIGLTQHSASMSNSVFSVQLAAWNTDQGILISDQRWLPTSAEVIANLPVYSAYGEVPPGVTLYTRAQATTSAISYVIVYGLGG